MLSSCSPVHGPFTGRRRVSAAARPTFEAFSPVCPGPRSSRDIHHGATPECNRRAIGIIAHAKKGGKGGGGGDSDDKDKKGGKGGSSGGDVDLAKIEKEAKTDAVSVVSSLRTLLSCR